MRMEFMAMTATRAIRLKELPILEALRSRRSGILNVPFDTCRQEVFGKGGVAARTQKGAE